GLRPRFTRATHVARGDPALRARQLATIASASNGYETLEWDSGTLCTVPCVLDRDCPGRSRHGSDGVGAGCEGRGLRENGRWADAACIARLWLLGRVPDGREWHNRPCRHRSVRSRP